ncbi:hypothetical protein BDP81DRAFT_31787 [Colletotrichum phormii]|uniref:Secreted protein n=1 Tax=Colletotrichum phormii TaxID=359342 RepID=A0AAJ0EDJ1_9PEZI|nr:uncharacterized protein BDP81DRAFT_31787 [Colletotrichum phormii]KAK1635962.1 hypothetical protein BDP81DRAFT_31787 [Colletotrichum phormii]
MPGRQFARSRLLLSLNLTQATWLWTYRAPHLECILALRETDCREAHMRVIPEAFYVHGRKEPKKGEKTEDLSSSPTPYQPSPHSRVPNAGPCSRASITGYK